MNMNSRKRLFVDNEDPKVAGAENCSDNSPKKVRFDRLAFLSNKLQKMKLRCDEFENFKKEVLWFANHEGLGSDLLSNLKSSEKEWGFILSAKTCLERLGCENLSLSMNIRVDIVNFRQSIKAFLEHKEGCIDRS